MTQAYGERTDVGRVRDHNEDNYVANAELGLWVVSDEMGGHEAGEVASEITVTELPERTRNGAALDEAIGAIHQSILDSPAPGRGAPGMGATVVALKNDGMRYRVAWVGDSRAYLWDGEHLQQLTRDHSFVQRLIDSGAITAEEAAEHLEKTAFPPSYPLTR